MIVGAHESTAGALANAFEHGTADRCEAIQVFTRSSRTWRVAPLAPEEIASWNAAREKSGIAHVFCHDSYLINLAAEPGELRDKSLVAFAEELARCDRLGIAFLVAHPGVHVSERRGLTLIARALDECFAAARPSRTDVLLENTAGQGVALGWKFEHLARILERSRSERRLGVCIDTCHLFAAGHDLTDRKAYDASWNTFNTVLGLSRLKAFHLNDSKRPLGSRVDRHHYIGKGCIGPRAFRRLLRDERFAGIPGVVELPDRKAENVARLKRLRGDA